MTNKELRLAARKLALDAGLREIKKSGTGTSWLGIYAGLFVMMNLDSIRLLLELTSPEKPDESHRADARDVALALGKGSEVIENEKTGADVDEGENKEEEENEEGDEFEGDAFRRVSAAGLPGDWFDQSTEGDWGFSLAITPERRGKLAPGVLDGILRPLAEDLHDMGADDSYPCSRCFGQATTLGHFESADGSVVAPYCGACWKTTQETTRGVIRVGKPIHPMRGWLFLLASSVVFALAWGAAQHPNAGIPFHIMFIACAAAGVGIAMGTSRFAQGSSLMLRIGVAVCVTLATLVGNMLGVKFLIDEQNLVVSWLDVIPLYLFGYLPQNLGQEILYFSCGVVGVIVGFNLMRKSERIQVR